MATPVALAHREERRLIGIDFTQDLLETGASVSSVAEIIILDTDNQDVTAEFRGDPVTTPETINGNRVSFFKERATGAEQAVGRYKVRCRVIVDNAEQPIALDDDGKLIYLRIVDD